MMLGKQKNLKIYLFAWKNNNKKKKKELIRFLYRSVIIFLEYEKLSWKLINNISVTKEK